MPLRRRNGREKRHWKKRQKTANALAASAVLDYFSPLLERIGSSVVEQRPFKPLVVGSSPTRSTTRLQSSYVFSLSPGEICNLIEKCHLTALGGTPNRSRKSRVKWDGCL